MIGILNPASLFILASLAQCPTAPPPTVEMKFINGSPTYDSRMTSAQLGGFDIDTTFSHHRNEVFKTGGVTEGKLKTGLQMTFRKAVDHNETYACVWLESVEVIVDYKPLVHMARELGPGTCEYNTTLQHENRHVGTDVITIREYLPQLESAIQQAAASTGVIIASPVSTVPQKKEILMTPIRQAMDRVVAALDATRGQRQQMIDTRQEYLRLSNACH